MKAIRGSITCSTFDLRLLEYVAGPIDDLRDEKGLHALSLVGQDAVGADQLLEGDAGSSQGHREVLRERRGDPHVGRVGRGVVDADLLEDLDRDDVPRMDQGVVQRRGPLEFLVEVLRLPDAVGAGGVRVDDGGVHDHGRGGHPLVEGRRVDERFEGRAGLAPGLGRPVEFAPVEVAPPDHRPDGAGLGVHRKQRPLDQPLFVSFAFLHLFEPLLHRIARRLLHRDVERRVDLEPLLVEDVAAVFLLDVAADVLDEVRGDLVLRLDRTEPERPAERLFSLRLRDVTVLQHPRENVGLPLVGPLRVEVGGIAAGGLGEAGQQGRFRQRQVARAFAEIPLGGGLDPVGSVAEVDVVEVEGDDLFFRQIGVDLVGEKGLLESSACSSFPGRGRGPWRPAG